MAKAPRRRRRWLWLGLLPALVLLALLGARALLEPQRLSTFLLQRASQATGLQLALAQPADVGLWPDLHLELNGLTATAPGAAVPLLRAERIDAVLPWSTLHSDALQIRSLRLVAPQLHVDALRSWLVTRASTVAPPPLPRIDAAVEVSEGRVAGGGWSVDHLSLRLPALLPASSASLEFSGTLRLGERVLPLAGQLYARPLPTQAGLRFDALQLVLRQPLALNANGSIDTGGEALTVALDGGLSWPPEWPELPLPADDGALRFELGYANERLALLLARGDAAIDTEWSTGELAAWRDDPAAALIPPLTGSARAERLQFDNIELRGVELKIEDDDATP